MGNPNKPRFILHLFVCRNERTDGRKSCGLVHGEMLVERFKAETAALGLKGQVRVNKAGCLDACAYGPTVVVYPEGTWYGGVAAEDVAEICREHLLHGRQVERLMVDFRITGERWLEQAAQHRLQRGVEPGEQADG